MKLYTIGHSNHPIDNFIQLLQEHGITTLVDVRSVPHSRFHPQFNRGNLQNALLEHKIEYLYEGASLGGRPTDPTCYVHEAIPKESKDYLHEVDYAEVMKRPWFIQGIERLLKLSAPAVGKAGLAPFADAPLAGRQSTCILCSEGDPFQCHRHHLIARYLMQNHPEVTILHILRDGRAIDAATLETIKGDPSGKQLCF